MWCLRVTSQQSFCGISVPCGHTSACLPFGMQILANHFDEVRMLRLAYAFERAQYVNLILSQNL